MLSRRGLLAAAAFPILRGQNRMFADAEAYELFMGRWSRLVAPHLVDFSGVSDGVNALDVGSGTGALSFAIVEKRPRSHVVGIDPSKEYVDYAASKSPFPDRLTFEVGDAQRMRFADSSFDASLSLLVFNFIPDPAKALREVRRVTKPGGRISAAVWDYGGGMQMLRMFWDAAASVDSHAEKADEKHMPLCRSGELSTLWRQEGLTDIHEQPLTITMKFASFSDFWDPFQLGQGPAGAFVNRLDRGHVQALRLALKARVAKAGESVPFALEGRVWAVRGTVAAGRG